jgi:predicted transcriptional regulator
MSNAPFSIILHYRRPLPSHPVELQIVRVDTAEEIILNDADFLLLYWKESNMLERCRIRHLMSGREISLQSGLGLYEFVRSCLLDASDKESP